MNLQAQISLENRGFVGPAREAQAAIKGVTSGASNVVGTMARIASVAPAIAQVGFAVGIVVGAWKAAEAAFNAYIDAINSKARAENKAVTDSVNELKSYHAKIRAVRDLAGVEAIRSDLQSQQAKSVERIRDLILQGKSTTDSAVRAEQQLADLATQRLESLDRLAKPYLDAAAGQERLNQATIDGIALVKKMEQEQEARDREDTNILRQASSETRQAAQARAMAEVDAKEATGTIPSDEAARRRAQIRAAAERAAIEEDQNQLRSRQKAAGPNPGAAQVVAFERLEQALKDRLAAVDSQLTADLARAPGNGIAALIASSIAAKPAKGTANGVSSEGGSSKDLASDRLARVGIFVGGSGGSIAQANRQTADNTRQANTYLKGIHTALSNPGPTTTPIPVWA